MLKEVSAYMNVPLSDYDEDMLLHVVDLLKEFLREQSEIILEDTWDVQKNQRMLYKNEDGNWELPSIEPLDISHSKDSEIGEMLEVMTVALTVKVEVGS
ncbi:hypothetical protein UF75_4724 [Desulfosporosinus sp. I2]|uniref:hypothetical protein n=1 Tax=Desulfosporosinus sp. I2 TaxID=1617025 RepID=UPI0005EFC852|nr:hypothetical protein [Desulfosporosinus sp. I2]KJR44887.1 hypothetical protein UF75_4724 [Desulfosporosinus sp. I2]